MVYVLGFAIPASVFALVVLRTGGQLGRLWESIKRMFEK